MPDPRNSVGPFTRQVPCTEIKRPAATRGASVDSQICGENGTGPGDEVGVSERTLEQSATRKCSMTRIRDHKAGTRTLPPWLATA